MTIPTGSGIHRNWANGRHIREDFIRRKYRLWCRIMDVELATQIVLNVQVIVTGLMFLYVSYMRQPPHSEFIGLTVYMLLFEMAIICAFFAIRRNEQILLAPLQLFTLFYVFATFSVWSAFLQAAMADGLRRRLALETISGALFLHCNEKEINLIDQYIWIPLVVLPFCILLEMVMIYVLLCCYRFYGALRAPLSFSMSDPVATRFRSRTSTVYQFTANKTVH